MRGWSNEQTQTLSPGSPGTSRAAGAGAPGELSLRMGCTTSIAGKIGCTAETLRKWVRRAEVDQRAGPTSTERERIRELERENRELKRANEILRKASAFFAQAELDR